MNKFIIFVLIIPCFLFSPITLATTQYLLIDIAKMKQHALDLKYEHITGPALPATEPGGQLLFYIRSCGRVPIPKNSHGEIPKKGQNITVSIEGHCNIVDWK